MSLGVEQQPGEKNRRDGAQVSQLSSFAGRRIGHADYLSRFAGRFQLLLAAISLQLAAFELHAVSFRFA